MPGCRQLGPLINLRLESGYFPLAGDKPETQENAHISPLPQLESRVGDWATMSNHRDVFAKNARFPFAVTGTLCS